MVEGKSEFYRKAEQSLTARGYKYFDGDQDVHGKGPSHANKPDYIATKKGIIVIGEIKSPKEGPKSPSWRQVQSGDSSNFKAVRLDVASQEKAGIISPEVGGHEIIIRGQLVEYVNKNGITYDLPEAVSSNGKILMGYTIPILERTRVIQALKICGKKIHDEINIGNDSVTYIFS